MTTITRKGFFERLTFYLITVFVVVIDQAIKFFAVFGGAKTVCNEKLAFGLGSGWAALNGSVVLLAILFTLYWFLKVKDDYKKFALCLILGGGISNLVGRFWGQGCVIDIFHLPFWPSFNIADVAISFGAFFLLMMLLKSGK